MELIEYILIQNVKFNYYILIKSNSNTNNTINLFRLFNIGAHDNDWKFIKSNSFTISNENNDDFINQLSTIDKVSYKTIKDYTFKFKINDINGIELYIFASIRNGNIISEEIHKHKHSIVFIKTDRGIELCSLSIVDNIYYYINNYGNFNTCNKHKLNDAIILGHTKYDFDDFVNLTSLEYSILHYCNTIQFLDDKFNIATIILKDKHIINF